MIVLAYIFAFIGIILFELPSLILNKHWWEAAVFLGLSGFAFLLGLLMILQVNIPNPVDWITKTVEYFLDLVSI